jgi:hypothetical protein
MREYLLARKNYGHITMHRVDAYDALGEGPRDPAPVKLSYVTDSEVKRLGRDGGEPQTVQTKHPSSVSMNIDSTAAERQAGRPIDKTDILITSQTLNQGYPGPLMSQVTRLAIERFSAWAPPPNVNIRNNTISFTSSNTGAVAWFANLTPAFYLTSALLIAEIVTQLNVLTGVTGLTFSSAPVPGFPDTYTLSSAGGTYVILAASSAIRRGRLLYALPDAEIPAASNTVGPMGLIYTPFVDICSETLTRYARKRSNSNQTNSAPSLVARAFVFDSTDPVVNPRQIPYHVMETDSFIDAEDFDWLTYDSSQDITTIDFQLRDCFGDLLYVTPAPAGTINSPFNWLLNVYYM